MDDVAQRLSCAFDGVTVVQKGKVDVISNKDQGSYIIVLVVCIPQRFSLASLLPLSKCTDVTSQAV
jgi:hypothetical protein